MSTTSGMQGERSQAVTGNERRASSDAPHLIAPEEMTWAQAPDVFPRSVQLCLLHGDPAAEGKVFTVRLRASEHCLFAPHSHPHDEHVTVVSGRLELGDGATADRSSTRVLEPGGYAFLPKERFHYAWAWEDSVFQVEAVGPFGITYARPEDDPRRAQ